jgi:hypothetical protein
MDALSTVLYYEMFFVLTALAATVAYRLLTGRINTAGLLRDKVSGRAISPGRLQLLVVTLVVAVYFVAQVVEIRRLPVVPREFMLGLGGSHLIYLGGKAYAVLGAKLELAAARVVGKFR